MKKKSVLLFFIFLTINFYSQLPVFNWAKNVSSGMLNSTGPLAAIDASNNTYLSGSFTGTVDVDPTATSTILVSSGNSDISICKYNNSGNLLWAKKIGNSFDEAPVKLILDPSGNIYLCGVAYGIVDLDPGAGTFTISGTTFGSGFIVKLDNSGNFIWGKSLINSFSSVFNSIDLDSFGNIYGTGEFNATTDFDLGAGTFTMAVNAGSTDMFVLKLDGSGNFLWAKKVGGIGSDIGRDLKIDASGNPVILGYFDGNNVDFDPGASIYTVTSVAATADVFLQKLDANGNFLWVKIIGGPSSDVARALTIDATGNIIATGNFNGSGLDLDPSVGTYTLASNGLSDVFCCKLDPSGNFLWGNKYGGTGDDYPSNIVADVSGDIYLNGSFQNSVDFDPSPLIQNVVSIGNYDIFFTRIGSSTGSLVWARSLGGVGADDASSILVNSLNDIFLSGSFNVGSAVDFNTEAGTFTMTSAGAIDGFLLRIGQCLLPGSPNNTTANSLACSPINTLNLTASGTGTLTWYNLPTGGVPLNSGNSFNTPTLAIGNHTFYVQAINSCTTSLLRTPIIVTVAPTPTISAASSNSLICIGQTATLSASGATTYTWNTAAISSVVAISPTVTTNYTVTGTNINGCSNMATITQSVSACTSLDYLNASHETKLNIYPNPTNGAVNLSVEGFESEYKVQLTNALGQIILSDHMFKKTNNIDITKQPNGIYFLQLITKNKIVGVHKIIKQ